MKEKKDIRSVQGMTVLAVLLMLGVGIGIVVRLINIQWVHGQEWNARAENREASLRVDPARRGTIYSSDGKVLATTVTECDFYLDLHNDTLFDKQGNIKYDSRGGMRQTGPIVDSNFEKHLDTVCLLLHQAVPSKSEAYFREHIKRGRDRGAKAKCYLVQRGLPYSVWKEITLVPGWGRGVVKRVDGQSVEHQVRAHIYGNMVENTIGFMNSRIEDSYTGLEGYYDSLLRGQDGIYNCRRLTKGMWLPDEPRSRQALPQRTDDDHVDTIIVQNKVDGRDIVASIDTRYQDIAENALRHALHEYRGTSGCAILMEVKTGYVLACANLATDTTVHEYREVRDRNVAVSDVYQPGSTFKTVVMASMLSDPAITIDTAMQVRVGSKNYNGGKKDGQVDDDHRVKGKDGLLRDSLNVREVMEQSSNVGMTELGWNFYRMQRRSDTLRRLMLDHFPYEKLNPDVVAPQARSYIHEDMQPVSNFTRLCYGYSTRITPLQLITFYNALAGNGRMVKPLFCRAMTDADGRMREVKPVVMNPQVINPRVAKMLQTMLIGVVNRGTGRALRSDTYQLAGKTGTAVKTRGYDASFAGFFPAENPKYTCIALIENCYAYGWQAGTVVKAIADGVVAMDKDLSKGAVKTAWQKVDSDSIKAFRGPFVSRGNREELEALYKGIKLPYHFDNGVTKWVAYQSGTDSIQEGYFGYSPTEGVVPGCIGMTAKDAIALLHSMGYKVRVNGYGKVVSQTPKAGSLLNRKGMVEINLR